MTDANGCSSICGMSVITILSPVISCPEDVTVECDESTLPSETGTATATNNCDLLPMVDYNDIVLPGGCQNEFEVIRTWNAVNACGNSSSCIRSISVIDSVPPIVICPEDMTIECAELVPAIDITSVVTSDNCDGSVIVTHTGDLIADLTCVNSFTLIRSYLGTDSCGNATPCYQLIRVSDTTPPEIAFVDSALLSGDTLWVQCFGQDPDWDLPTFNEGSIIATDFCAGDLTIDFSQFQLSHGACENGIINLYRLSWIVTDECGNSDSVYLMLSLIDTIGPVIYNVPEDITVNCDEIPPLPDDIFATDECLCVCIVLVEETELNPGCINGQILLRSWTAIDGCGNMTTATQRITLVDDTGPEILILHPEISGITNGSVLDYTCADGGIPAFFEELGTGFEVAIGNCGSSFILHFEVDTLFASDCETQGFVEQRTYHWVAEDECGNQSSMSIYARLIDYEAPVFTNVPEMACISDLIDVDATDNCGFVTIEFEDYNIPNPCGSGLAVKRIYQAVDVCGNSSWATSILIPNDQSPPVIEFINPVLTGLGNGTIRSVNCAGQNGLFTSFGTWDVHVESACGDLDITFTEELIAMGDCLEDGIVATVKLQWTATDLCGNSSEQVIFANIVDESPPVFVDFLPVVSIGCNDELPELIATDNCGEVAFQTTWDSIIYGDCIYEYEIQRLVTATDECENSITMLQIIHVGNGDGPTFNGITELVCNDATIPVVTAYDACAGEFSDVTMVADTIDSSCGMIIERIWTATDICGNTATSNQRVVLNDTIPPEFVIPRSSFIYPFLRSSPNYVYMSDIYQFTRLSELNSTSFLVTDNCEQPVQIEFRVEIEKAEDCLENGYMEYRTYVWIATDICGNSSTLSFSVYIVNDVPPVFMDVPEDITVVCEPLPATIPPVFQEDSALPVSVVFSETTKAGTEPGTYIVTRTWTATDACGNVTVYVQTITWIPDTFEECHIVLPPSVECNTHGLLICVDDSYNIAGTSFHWEIEGEDCFIQSSPDSACILIYIGWSPVDIILRMTDPFGCVSTCVTTQDCDFVLDKLLLGNPTGARHHLGVKAVKTVSEGTSADNLKDLRLYPNPSSESITISFESGAVGEVEFYLINILGELIQRDKMTAGVGFNSKFMKIGHIPEGSYLLQVKTENGIRTKVVVIMRNQ